MKMEQVWLLWAVSRAEFGLHHQRAAALMILFAFFPLSLSGRSMEELTCGGAQARRAGGCPWITPWEPRKVLEMFPRDVLVPSVSIDPAVCAAVLSSGLALQARGVWGVQSRALPLPMAGAPP